MVTDSRPRSRFLWLPTCRKGRKIRAAYWGWLLGLAIVAAFLSISASAAPRTTQTTYCNPIKIDYGYCPIPDFVKQGKHRATADPVIVMFRGDYYLFSINQKGYWWSTDMLRWNFVPRAFLKPWHKVYDELLRSRGVGDE
ncbi:MAG: hypothetical protein L0Z50_22450 [Verrucomicrobiales bacterium]|nr:hypothetical protein [Verrucomicrobiales bacterium]